MGVLANQMGLGIVLGWKNMVSKGTKEADRDLKKLKGTVGKTADAFERRAVQMGAAMDGFQKQMRSGFKMMLVGAAITAPFAFATVSAAGYEQKLADVKSLLMGTGVASNLASQQVAALGAQILRIGPQSKITIDDLASSSYDLVSANLTVNEAMGLLKPTADLAVAGMGTMKEATNSMTSAINTFGKKWGDQMTPFEKGTKIANIYAGTIAGLKTTLPDLSAAMAYAAGDATVLGASLAETTVAIGLLQTKGVFGAKAGTTIQAMFRGFLQFGQKSTSALGPLAGMNLKDTDGSLRAIADIVQEIEERLKGFGEFERASILLQAFGEESSRAMKLLLGQSAAMRENVQQVEQSNALLEMTAAREDTLITAKEKLIDQFKAFMIIIGTGFIPAMKMVGFAIGAVTGLVMRLATNFPVLTKLLSMFIAAIGITLFLMGAIKVASAAIGIMNLMMMFTGGASIFAAGGMMAFAASTWAALWPILAVVAGLTAIIALIAWIAGFDLIGAFKNTFAIPTAPNLSSLGMAGGGSLSLQGGASPIGNQFNAASSGGSNTVIYDYSTNRKNNTFNIDGAKNPKQIAKETTRVQNRDKNRSHDGQL